jgi:hypothetical protein
MLLPDAVTLTRLDSHLVSDCPPLPPQPSLFAIVSPNQRVNTGQSVWPIDGASYWHLAIFLFVLILLVTVLSYVRLARFAPPGWRRRLSALLVGVGALGMLMLVGYLLLVGWPGTQFDTLWWFNAFSLAGSSMPCHIELNQLDDQHTQMRNALNNRALWGLLGPLALFILGHLISLSRGASRPLG